jgi:tetratricopeptide (TPR) repeat protein
MVEKQKLETILEAVERADRHADRQELAEARETLVQARADCERAGMESGFLMWRLCVVLDLMKEHELAFKYAQEALRQDPLAPPFRHSFAIVVKKMRTAIVDAEAAPDWVPRFYDLLVHAGEGTDEVHVAMARWRHTQGQHQKALTLVNAVTLLSPRCSEAWTLRSAICRSLGDEQAAREAEIEAAAVAAPAPAPFAVPGATA